MSLVPIGGTPVLPIYKRGSCMSMPKGTNRTLKESQRPLETFSMTIVSPYRRKLPLGSLDINVSKGTISTLIVPL